MKIIMCGPPHSGKSVLISNLHYLMPLESFRRITANGDGEGLWSNNKNQAQVKDTRVKGSNEPEDFRRWKKMIEDATEDVVLVDIGGKLQDDKAVLFDAADAFIVLCREPEEKDKDDISFNPKEWEKFGTEHECRCLGIIKSELTGSDEIFETSPYFQARLTGLVRGAVLTDSPVIKKLADIIICESNYLNHCLVDFYKLSTQFDCSSKWTASNGIVVNSCFYKKENALKIYNYMKTHFKDKFVYELKGANANWTAAVAGLPLLAIEGSRVMYFDPWVNNYIQAAPINKTDDPKCEIMDWQIQESDSAVYIKFKLPKPFVERDKYAEYVVPEIDESKDLYISGKFPNWFTVSILSSYSCKKKFVYEPGSGFVCVQSPDDKELGSISKGENFDASMDVFKKA